MLVGYQPPYLSTHYAKGVVFCNPSCWPLVDALHYCERACWLQQRRTRNDISCGNNNIAWQYTPMTETTCSAEFSFLSAVAWAVAESSRHPLTSKAVVRLITTIRSINAPGPYQDASKQVPNGPQLAPLFLLSNEGSPTNPFDGVSQ